MNFQKLVVVTCSIAALAMAIYPVLWIFGAAGDPVRALEGAVFASCLLASAVVVSARP